MNAVLDRCEKAPETTTPSPIRVRDPDDERILADAIAAGVDILVTGDQDLLAVARKISRPHPVTEGVHHDGSRALDDRR